MRISPADRLGSTIASTRDAVCARLGEMSFSRRELAGSLGDLGTFLPLTLGVSSVCGLHFGTTLVFAGVCNIATGIVFRTPMCVQPMKAIAALAIASRLTAGEVIAAGFVTAAIILVISLSGLLGRLAGSVPRPVVAGIQLGLAAKIISTGVAMSFLGRSIFGWDSYLVAAAAFVLLLALAGNRAVPGALVVFGLGLIAAIAGSAGAHAPATGGMRLFSLADFGPAVSQSVIAQVPLTLINSILAVSVLSNRLFPDRPASERRIGVSVGLMNLLGTALGGQPMCHGAGGLSAQYHFGARTAGSMVMLGGMKIVGGLLFSGCLFTLLMGFPASILGVMLLFSAYELSKPALLQSRKAHILVSATTAALMLALGTAAGVVLGIVVGFPLLRWAGRAATEEAGA